MGILAISLMLILLVISIVNENFWDNASLKVRIGGLALAFGSWLIFLVDNMPK